MSGINKDVVFRVARIRCRFTDSVATSETIVGTGFWVEARSGLIAFVTNGHNLDPSFWQPPRPTLALAEVEIEIRRREATAPGISPASIFLYPDVCFFRVENFRTCLGLHKGRADCGILLGPEMSRPAEYALPPPAFKLTDIADHSFLAESAQTMDAASFIGFPESDGNPWWDERATLPIARMVTLASTPEHTFVNSQIKSEDVVLVSGLSFKGSSGSPVILHSKGIKVDPPLNSWYVPAKIIGIMSGHWNESGPVSSMLEHSGLSYFTRSTSILEMLP